MKAIHHYRYGGPEVLELVEVERPTPAVHQVLLEVVAAAVNPLDDHLMRADPSFVRIGEGLRRPRNPGLGADVAGIVVEVGTEVTKFAVGDRLWGDIGPSGLGSFAEYVLGSEKDLVYLPEGVDFAAAAASPVAALTALQALRDYGKLAEGERVLINGASGGVGHFAVQMAKALGASEVTGVCSERNVEMVLALGADHVIDYAGEDFTNRGEKYDLIIDMVANRSTKDLRRALKQTGRCIVGGFSGMMRLLSLIMVAPIGNRKGHRVLMMPSAKVVLSDLTLIGEMLQDGRIAPSIEARFPLARTAEALAHLATGRTRGKLIIDVNPQ